MALAARQLHARATGTRSSARSDAYACPLRAAPRSSVQCRRAPRRALLTTCSYSDGSWPGPSGAPSSSGSATRRDAELETLRKQLRALEGERDEAVRTAESCAKTCVRLTDMARLLEELALEKVKAGDDAGAKLVLQEKNSLREIVDKSNEKAQTNFALAGKLASKIGVKQNELVALMGGNTTTPSSSSNYGSSGYGTSSNSGYGGAAAAASRAAWPDQQQQQAASRPPAYDTGADWYGSSGSTGGGAAGGGYTAPQMPWERSLQDAQQRVRQAEAEAQRMGSLAAMSAEQSIEAARQRLAASRPGGSEDIVQARNRLRRSAEASISEARERLRAQDAKVLEYARRVVSRYRRGEPVTEDELEFAFAQMERRLY